MTPCALDEGRVGHTIILTGSWQFVGLVLGVNVASCPRVIKKRYKDHLYLN
jgi:hypothetical protein